MLVLLSRFFATFIAVLLVCTTGMAEVVKIGNVSPNTGVGAAYGESQTTGCVLAVEEINERGGIPGVGRVELFTEDSGSTSAGAVKAAIKLIQHHKVIGIVGESMSANTLAILPITARHEIPQLTPVSSAPSITQQGSKYIFRLQITAARSGWALARYLAQDRKFNRVAIINDTNEFGLNYAKAVANALAEFNAGPVTQQSYTTGDKDFTAQLLKIRDAGADALVISGQYTEGALIVTQMRQLGLKLQVAGPDGLAHPMFIKLAGDAADGLLFTNTYVDGVDDPKTQEFAAKHEKRFGIRSNNGSALSYDCVNTLAKAIEKTASTDPKKIRDALASIEYDGLTGKIQFNDTGDSTLQPKIFAIKGNKYILMRP